MNKNDYLTEKILGEYLNFMFNQYDIIHNKTVPNSGIINRPDYRIEDLKLIIEFDGYRHFNNTRTILNDIKKDKVYSKMGYSIIRIPYFIQLRDDVLMALFDVYLNKPIEYYMSISSEYSLGFIDKKCLLPADYCELGLYSLEKYYTFYSNIIDKFYKYFDYTLIDKALEYDSILSVFNKNNEIINFFKDNCIPGYSIDLNEFPGIMNELKIIESIS